MVRDDEGAQLQRDDAKYELDPQAASTLVDESVRQAQRTFNTWPPLLLLLGSVLFPLALGEVWWSVRSQHPYHGPTGGALTLMYSIIVVWAITVSSVVRHATRGIGGRSMRQRKIEGIGFAGLWIAVYVFQYALLHAGASPSITYGIYPATAPFIFVGSAFAISSAQREDWPKVFVALPMVAIAVVASFMGPVLDWLVVGIGLGALLFALGVGQLLQG
ncbi:MAG: hypothetical protein HKL86_01745 [Acidimicrobiaceae bacterium]|nr:hypothetical protein [Acidimicrobiaceae bacterium]